MTRLIVLLAALLACAHLAACTTVPRTRTLPNSIRTIYLPMAVNRSAEPAVEERMTQFVQEEFLADGRLRLVQKKKADAVVEIEIRKFDSIGSDAGVTDFMTRRNVTIEANLVILRNIPGRPKIGGVRKVVAQSGFNTDTRSTGFVPEPDWKDQVLREFARNAVREVLTGDYKDSGDVLPGYEEAAALPATAAP